MLYFLLAYISLTRIERVQDEYLRNLAVGIVALISMQAFINI